MWIFTAKIQGLVIEHCENLHSGYVSECSNCCVLILACLFWHLFSFPQYESLRCGIRVLRSCVPNWKVRANLQIFCVLNSFVPLLEEPWREKFGKSRKTWFVRVSRCRKMRIFARNGRYRSKIDEVRAGSNQIDHGGHVGTRTFKIRSYCAGDFLKPYDFDGGAP